MNREQSEILKRFAHDDRTFTAVQNFLRDYFLRPGGNDVHYLAAEKILLNRLPGAFNAIKSIATEKEEHETRGQVGL